MRPCRLNPKLSAFEALEGAFHFTSTPFYPPGTKVLAHKNPGRRASWGFQSNKGWYIGPALNHHQCYRYITQSTGGERITDTIKFQHHNVKVPQLAAADRITSAARKLQRVIKQQPAKAPMEELQAIKLLRHVLLVEKPLKLTTKPMLTIATQQSSPSTPTPDLTYISSASDSDDDSVAPFLNLPDDEDKPAPEPCYNLRSNHTVTSVNTAVDNVGQEAIRQCQLEVNPDIIPPIVIKEVSHFTRGYCQANKFLQLSHWAWSRLAQSDSLFVGSIIND